MIEVRNLFLKYIREYYALYDINLKINKGESVSLIGADASGKTSLLRILAKLEKFTSGEVYIKDIPLVNVSFQNDVQVGYLPEKPVFLKNKTVYDNFVFFFNTWKISSKEREEKINKALIDFSIEKYKNEKIKNLSLYEQYLISLIRLSFRKLDIILIDNIFDALSDEEYEKIKIIIKQLFGVPKVTSIIATTKEKIAKELTERKVYFNFGSIIKEE